ncbi:MAG: hypothetical protein KKA62_01795 [Nanoarchaeota archaeon]|nr:hypothetical protein [Nanoarchaeota archaeon]MBU1643814.1 hypothetical protein [Nanoarchaeota archaeon]MBU1976666.1 hypothetical protein [Nanoarchaeota archaeon]
MKSIKKIISSKWTIPLLLTAILIAVIINIAITTEIAEDRYGNSHKTSWGEKDNRMQEKTKLVQERGWSFFKDHKKEIGDEDQVSEKDIIKNKTDNESSDTEEESEENK